MRIELIDVSVVFEKNTDVEKGALEGVNLSFTTSDRVLLVGETGSGKTTFIYLLDLLIKPSAGSMFYDGVNPFSDAYRFRKKFGVAFQIPERQFFNDTVRDELTYACHNFRVPYNDDEVIELLNLVGLDEKILRKSPFKLSGGEQRKVAIASVLLHKPEFVILDEPTAGLDLRGVDAILGILEKFRANSIGFLIATHEPEIFEDLWNIRISLTNGRVTEVKRNDVHVLRH